MALRIKTSPLFWNNKGKCCARASIAQFTQFGKLIALTDDSRKVDDETFTRGRRAAAARDVSYAVFEDTFYPWLRLSAKCFPPLFSVHSAPSVPAWIVFRTFLRAGNRPGTRPASGDAMG